MVVRNILKLLSGALNGVEFTLKQGDTVFHVGPQAELMESQHGATMAQADNTFYLPSEAPTSQFVVRVRVADDEDLAASAHAMPAYSVGELNDQHELVFRPIAVNEVFHVGAVYFAVRPETQQWSSEVMDFRLPVVGELIDPTPSTVQASTKTSNRLWLAAAFLLCASAVGFGAYHHFTPEVQVQGIVAALEGAPGRYDVLYGRDGNLYAVADSPADIAWGARAAKRLNKQIRFIERSLEAERLAHIARSVGGDAVLVRMDAPSAPQVMMSAATANTTTVRRVKAAILTAAPYAQSVIVTKISDSQLVTIAQGQLRAQGISTRVEIVGGRISVSNDTFLDDASLHAMAAYITSFERQWGGKHVTVQIRLWDDLLKGRSYQYAPNQLLSVGEGRWQYSRNSAAE